MCGRFTLFAEPNEIISRFNVSNGIADYKKRYNIAPSQTVLVVINDGNENRAVYFRWGLIPHWAKETKIGYKMINARAETLNEKPTFKHPFRRQRCIIPADGFYEWKNTPTGKQPYRITLKTSEIFGFAGLWDRWEKDGQEIHSCTIITTEPNELMSQIHNRMPVILNRDDEQIWLNNKLDDTDFLRTLLKPYNAQEMEVYPVSTLVNSPKNNDPSLIEQV